MTGFNAAFDADADIKALDDMNMNMNMNIY